MCSSDLPWRNPSAWSDKLEWVERHLGPTAEKRLILTHNKQLNRGHFLVDDRPNNGAELFGMRRGQKWLHFGHAPFDTWSEVIAYLRAHAATE